MLTSCCRVGGVAGRGGVAVSRSVRGVAVSGDSAGRFTSCWGGSGGRSGGSYQVEVVVDGDAVIVDVIECFVYGY
jgi:hypothetical protein